MKNARRHNGSKYDPALDVKEIAVRLRAEYKDAIKAGTLPKMKIGVRIERYSGGRSIRVTLKDVQGIGVINPEYWQAVKKDGHGARPAGERYTEEFKAAKARVEEMREAYNFDDSDSMTDYFHVNYYGNTDVDWEYEQELLKSAGLE